jgi:ribosomal protein S18 acetylase RimI-like enzyme
MKISIRKANENDFSQILGLIKELALFENAPEKVTNSVEQMKSEQEYFNCFVAEDSENKIVGIALYYFAYYTWVGKSLYLDDLIVKEEFRGQNIGTQLLNEIMKVAKLENCNRVRWQVLDWNTPAIDFYKKMNAELDSEWINCDFDKKGITKFIKNC